MPVLQHVVLCALFELVLSIAAGWPLARLLATERSAALALAPVVGWAVFAGISLPVLTWTGLTRATAALVCGAAVLGGVAALLRSRRNAAAQTDRAGVPAGAFAAAAFAAIIPALAVWPKQTAAGTVLAEPMFDHSKIALIDDIARLGLPPGNPFCGISGAGAPKLAYYYLWHFDAAVPTALLGVSGWEADIALTWFTAFASLALMMGLAARLGGRRLAAPLVVLLSLAGSLRPVLRFVAPAGFLDRALAPDLWPQSWLFQASWAPQHLASANCVVVAVLIAARLASRHSWPLVPLLAAIVAAGFESSAWVGGIVFAAAALPIGIALLLLADSGRSRLELVLEAVAALVLVAAIAYPFLHDEYLATASRAAGLPIALHPYRVLGPIVPANVRHLLDLPAYWLILLGVQFPAILFAAVWTMAGALTARGTSLEKKRLIISLSLLAAASFVVPSLFASTIANNDLGWRGVLPGILVLTVFAAAGLARWLAAAPGLAMAALACWGLGVAGGAQLAEDNAFGFRAPSAGVFAETPALWAAVRRHTAPDERIANNPLFLADTVRWPVNISWALLADRRSCYAGWNLARAFMALPEAEIDAINALFERVFAGRGSSDDVRDLATRYDCRVAVVTPSDGAWRRDPFAASPYFRLVEEEPDKWRIYRIVEGARDRR